MESNKEFDIAVLGPTGYTGKFCAEYIVKNLPTNLKWALAGRSLSKIENVAKELKALNPDRSPPVDTIAVQLNQEELYSLAQRTKLIINCIIPSVGFESVPADILSWILVKRVREEFSCHTREITCAIDELKSSGASGGTLSTILSIFDSLSISDMFKSIHPFAIAASAPKSIPSEPFINTLLGVRSVRDMGVLTTAPITIADRLIVHRSSTLMPEFYGPQFYFREFIRVRNVFIGVALHIAFVIGLLLLTLPPVRFLLRRIIYTPGSGPRREDSTTEWFRYRAVATVDQTSQTPKRVLGILKYQGSLYALTGLLMAEAAMVVLENEAKVKKVSRAGIVTSATLGQEYADRLEKAGCRIETRLLEY
ncbi:uncharacterized protein ATNIH1004_004029 [Aspergillus tanneri]|uniref:Uncharacterized protein n=1 Tax=Aspergillus tanneri TaxID=1220188 RepID=A0A5M9MQG1_9EURO|nr:uncharacterized protein ATNIH1004_004029 [Aspergillus tanneri]KAA8648146.1 hypothetical protein ATNIH1004_004029 [Aspergillus tanneri]